MIVPKALGPRAIGRRKVPNCVPRGKGPDKLSKPSDDPCWETHVQRGMKDK